MNERKTSLRGKEIAMLMSHRASLFGEIGTATLTMQKPVLAELE